VHPPHIAREEILMELVQSRIVTDAVEKMATFYAALVGVSVIPNEYYVEVPTGSMSIGFSKPRFTEDHSTRSACPGGLGASRGESILDFAVEDIDHEYRRVDALGVDWVLLPMTQPWGKRSMIFRDPEGHLVNVFSRPELEDQ
jgi:predicted enzyme related to lactoylglutathione lyase